jgi:hypothetical protein
LYLELGQTAGRGAHAGPGATRYAPCRLAEQHFIQ